MRKRWTVALAGVVLALYFVGLHELILLALGGVVGLIAALGQARRFTRIGALVMLPSAAPLASLAAAVPVTSAHLFLLFLKIGAVLYGSGYVLLAFMQGDFVDRLGWLTQQQLLDAIAIGQVTPGPVFTTASFVGYVLGGWGGAALATIGIFLPSFVFVAMLNPLVTRVRANRWTGGVLDGVNASAIALMAGVSVRLGQTAIVDVWTGILAALAAILLMRFGLRSTWLIGLGAIAGIVVQALAA